jgi:hypothetical protein
LCGKGSDRTRRRRHTRPSARHSPDFVSNGRPRRGATREGHRDKEIVPGEPFAEDLSDTAVVVFARHSEGRGRWRAVSPRWSGRRAERDTELSSRSSDDVASFAGVGDVSSCYDNMQPGTGVGEGNSPASDDTLSERERSADHDPSADLQESMHEEMATTSSEKSRRRQCGRSELLSSCVDQDETSDGTEE